MRRKKKIVIDCTYCLALKATGEFCNRCLLSIHEDEECKEDIVTLPECHDISALCYERHCCCFKGMDKCDRCQKKLRDDQLLFDEASKILAQSLRATEQEICQTIEKENTEKKCNHKKIRLNCQEHSESICYHPVKHEDLTEEERLACDEWIKELSIRESLKCHEKDHKDLFCQTEELTWPPPKNTIRASRYEGIERKEITDKDIEFLEGLKNFLKNLMRD